MIPKGDILLSRDAFREGTHDRDGHKCVRCGRKPDGKFIRIDAHHIMERRLWTAEHQFGGYFLDNGATLCDTGYEKLDGEWSCHLMAGMTLISPDEVRKMAGIENVLLPEHLYADIPYTVWGDPVLPGGKRMRGELFWDESVQLMLKMGGVLPLYSPYVRHPRTYHLPISPKISAAAGSVENVVRMARTGNFSAIASAIGDDKVMHDLSRLKGQRIIVTAKMDGGQTSLYEDYMHLRTTDFKSDETTHRLQAFHAKIKYHLKGLRLNVENLVGSFVTGIQYHNLSSYFQVFMLWDNEKNICLSWDETREFVGMLDDILKSELNESRGLPLVKSLYDGLYDEKAIMDCMTPTLDGDELEGVVVRAADRFHYKDFRLCVGKVVRAHHQVRHDRIYVPNELRPTDER